MPSKNARMRLIIIEMIINIRFLERSKNFFMINKIKLLVKMLAMYVLLR